MKKIIQAVLFLFIPYTSASEPTVEPVAFVDCKEIPQSFGEFGKPQDCRYGSKIYFMISDGNITNIKSDSLTLNKLEIEGKDILAKRNGDDNYKLSSFPRVSDDAKHLMFSIEIKENEFLKLQNTKLSGAISYYTSKGLERHNQKFNLDQGLQTTLHSFDLKSSLQDDGNLIEIEVTRDFNSVNSIKLESNGIKLQSKGMAKGPQRHRYYFEAAGSSEIDIAITSWKNLNMKTQPFSYNQ
ncbi:hypothetical protein [Parendozoicomonas sp. Alg238-R29]|uniref:hypothetical protein n=1 Tax=Parendozoicomonas sp. Alg238-R29 TaxID=2993446 RepID=UPI00248E3786|nr:hypothetical protein [Parendozoicomonas sp. Alg238-R29]